MEDNLDTVVARIASQDFERARRRAFITDIFSVLRGRPNWLMSFGEVESVLPIRARHYSGLEQVPVANIIGSVDRYHDFDRRFLPLQTQTRPRWESVDRATLTDVVLPPVQLYRVGDAYFVKDGNHRVSVAREKGQAYIDAEVIECITTAPLSPSTDPRDLLLLAEYARFLDATHLDRLRPGADVSLTALGSYDTLLRHIAAHRWFMGIEQYRPVEWEEAVVDWYDHVYLPVVQVIEQDQILADFPGRTPADLYLWVMDHRWYLREEMGYDVGPKLAAASYDEKYATSWTRRVVRTLRRIQAATTRPVVLTRQMISRFVNERLGGDRVEDTAPAPNEGSPDGVTGGADTPTIL